jgi:hypothetical protein
VAEVPEEQAPLVTLVESLQLLEQILQLLHLPVADGVDLNQELLEAQEPAEEKEQLQQEKEIHLL